MRPSDLKSLRQILLSIREELSSLRTLFEIKLNSIHDGQECQRQEYEAQRKDHVKVATAIYDLKPTEDEKREQRSQNNKALAIQFLLMLGTFGAFIAAAIYAGIANTTLGEIKNQTRATQLASLAACRTAQIAQQNLLQIQRSNDLSRSAVASSAMQAAATVESERAQIFLVPGFPEQQALNGDVLLVPYSVVNTGKVAATGVHIQWGAVLIDPSQIFHITDKNVLGSVSLPYLGPSSTFPPEPHPPFHSVTPLQVVTDENAKLIPASSRQSQEFLDGNKSYVYVFGRVKYSDFSGTRNTRFCYPIGKMKPLTTESANPTTNELICAAYNSQSYSYLDNESSTPTPLESQQKPINCEEPPK